MRTNPDEKYTDHEAYLKGLTAKITRIAALVMAFLSTFFFFIKLLFL